MSTPEELRELDAFIAGHVIGHPTTRMRYKIGRHPKTKEWFWISIKSGLGPVYSIPRYSTDPAAAMEVLKKCSIERKQSVKIWFSTVHNQWAVADDGCFQTQYADTLELAICKFAKKLFTP